MARKNFIILMALLLMLCGCGEEAAQPGGAMPDGDMMGQGQKAAGFSVAVETQEISYATIEEYSKISCQVEADNEVTISPKVSGTVEKVYVVVGDTVQAGDVLFEIDRTALQRQVTQANTTYVQAQVNYDTAVNGNLNNELSNLKTSVKDKQYSYDNALQSYERNQALFSSGALAKSELETSEAAMEARKSELENAQRALSLYENTTMQGNLKTLEATLAQARSSYEAALDSLADASVKAEISGVIRAVNVSVGNTVSAQTDAVSIVDMQRAKLSFGVTDKVINHIAVGTGAEVTVSSVQSEPMFSTVSAVSPAADAQSGLYPVEIYIDNPNQTLKPGMFAIVRLATNRHENTISLPVDAVIEKNGIAQVFVVDKDCIAHKIQVETGLRNDEYIEIVSGLAMGDIVVVIGQDFLEDGNLVNITAGSTPQGASAAPDAAEKASEQPTGLPDGARPNGEQPPALN